MFRPAGFSRTAVPASQLGNDKKDARSMAYWTVTQYRIDKIAKKNIDINGLPRDLEENAGRGGAQAGKNRLKALCHRYRRFPTRVGNRGKVTYRRLWPPAGDEVGDAGDIVAPEPGQRAVRGPGIRGDGDDVVLPRRHRLRLGAAHLDLRMGVA